MSDFSPESGSFDDAVSRHPASQNDRNNVSDTLNFFATSIRANKNRFSELNLGIEAGDMKILLAASAFSLTVTGLLVNSDDILSIIDVGKNWVSDRFQNIVQPFGRAG